MIVLIKLYEIEFDWMLFFLVIGFLSIYNYVLIEIITYKFNTIARQRTYKEILRLLRKIAGENDDQKNEN